MADPQRHLPRRKSIRLDTWEYDTAAVYSVTICTANRKPWFGTLQGDNVTLSPEGQTALFELDRLPERFSNVQLGVRTVMPDHVHLILSLGLNEVSFEKADQFSGRTFGPLKSGSLSSVVNHYKGSVTRSIRSRGNRDFRWQPRFYDRIIRDYRELATQTDYIRSNPDEWRRNQ